MGKISNLSLKMTNKITFLWFYKYSSWNCVQNIRKTRNLASRNVDPTKNNSTFWIFFCCSTNTAVSFAFCMAKNSLIIVKLLLTGKILLLWWYRHFRQNTIHTALKMEKLVLRYNTTEVVVTFIWIEKWLPPISRQKPGLYN